MLKLRQQNETLKEELKKLSSKLEIYVQKSKTRKLQLLKDKQLHSIATTSNNASNAVVFSKIYNGQPLSSDPNIQAKERELREVQGKIQTYKKEIDMMRRQLEESYNIQKIIQLEDEQKNKQRILKQL